MSVHDDLDIVASLANQRLVIRAQVLIRTKELIKQIQFCLAWVLPVRTLSFSNQDSGILTMQALRDDEFELTLRTATPCAVAWWTSVAD